MKYVAFLRGIGPGNPNMHPQKLVGVLEELNFTNVKGVISSGNVIFESESKNIKTLEDIIQKSWPEKLGFNSTTIIRSQTQIQNIINKKPFGNQEFSKVNYQMVTFLKKGGEEFNVVDTTSSKTPKFMTDLEKKYGKEITSRTWKTVNRVLKAMELT